MTTTTESKILKEGDILLANWGYEANNPTFLKVVKRSNSMVHLMIMKNEIVKSDGHWGSYVKPSNTPATWHVWQNADHEQGQPVIIRRKVKKLYETEEYVRAESYCGAYLWDGKPAHEYNYH